MHRFIAGILLILTINGCSTSTDTQLNSEIEGINSNNKIVVLGDSIAAGHATNNYRAKVIFPDVLGDISGFTIISDSIPGITAEEAIEKIPALLKSERPKYLVILLGTNNALGRHGSTIDSALKSLHAATKMALDAGVIPIIGTLPPISRNSHENEKTQAISAGIVKITTARIARIDQVITPNDLVDGIHPSDKGQQKIAQEFAKHL